MSLYTIWGSLQSNQNSSKVKICDKCQRIGNISKRNKMPLNSILEVKIFDMWGINFMGPFHSSYGKQYILLIVDYMFKWVEVVTFPTNDDRVVTQFLKKNIFKRYGIPRAIISNGGKHFCNRLFASLLAKYRVKHHVPTPYHPQTSRQVEISNGE
ncbi:uncharacterized protein LOC111372063 [Olea europaea var. sylvestris]|uniref:uncharacterized protein LOC111372063 n=1 Tax=Olea europaea var. sylvestris TaxID=158386 RepID=UPI000C1D72D8|nr:uncharacterized protein LOC111372063 [Olea europaea var. sylvestris]